MLNDKKDIDLFLKAQLVGNIIGVLMAGMICGCISVYKNKSKTDVMEHQTVAPDTINAIKNIPVFAVKQRQR